MVLECSYRGLLYIRDCLSRKKGRRQRQVLSSQDSVFSTRHSSMHQPDRRRPAHRLGLFGLLARWCCRVAPPTLSSPVLSFLCHRQKSGPGGGVRTPDLLLMTELLHQLSYTGFGSDGGNRTL